MQYRHCVLALCPAGALPDRRMPTVLVSTLLTEVRGFSDFCAEFFKVGFCLQYFPLLCITHYRMLIKSRCIWPAARGRDAAWYHSSGAWEQVLFSGKCFTILQLYNISQSAGFV